MNDDIFLDVRAVCRMAGGSRPLSTATIYRQIGKGCLPRPVRIGGSSRWLRAEIEAALASMVEGRP
jgi:predicted DNA-binding transcriptional regulator AlpA